MSIYIGNDLEDRLKALEAENASLRKYNKYNQVVKSVQSALSDLKHPPEHLQSQCNYRPFIS